MAPLNRHLPLTFLATSLILMIFATLTLAITESETSLQPRDLNDTTWHKYVRAPSSTTISPVRWLPQYSNGSITNGDGIIGDGVTTLTRTDESDDVPSIVLDFGQNYAGILSINFAGAEVISSSSSSNASALPGITLAFSESLEYLTNRSDFTRSDNQADGDKVTSSGTDQVAVQLQPYTWTNQLGCQYPNENKVCSDGFHGFRYLRITLQALASDAPYTTGFGNVSIDSVSLAYSAYQGTPDTFTGWFECSDTDLTQWWYDAVYTNDLTTDVFRANDTDPRNANTPSLVDKVVLFDGAKRDRDPYVGDLAVSALTLYLTHDNAVAARNVLADLADHQRSDGWIPPASINNYTLQLFDYPLWWVVCSSDLVLYTGDTAYLDTYYANLVLTLDTYYPNATNADGLLEKGLGTTAGYGDYAFLPRTGVITYYNALYVLALTRAAQLAEIHGSAADAARWRERAAVVGPALMTANWDASVGALYDGGSCDDTITNTTKCDVHAQDGNGLAILSGATNNSVAASLVSSSSSSGSSTADESILNFMTGALSRPYGNAFYDKSTLSPDSDFDQRVYAFISYFELAARFQVASNLTGGSNSTTASADAIAASAYDELKRLYGYMATNDPFSTFWEGIGPNGSYYEAGFTSLAHGWSTGIVPVLQNYVLGVRPTGSGFSTFDVRPVVTGGVLQWARGVVPTPNNGAIGVDWTIRTTTTTTTTKRAGDDQQQQQVSGLTLIIDTPAGSSVGTVYVPVAVGNNNNNSNNNTNTQVTEDGVTIWTESDGVSSTASGVSYEDGYVVVIVQGGSSHTFETS